MLASTDKLRKKKQELVSTKLQLASDEIAKDNMACELVKTNAAALLAKGRTTRSEDDGIANFNHEAIGYTTKTVTTMVVVPTMNPFSRKKKKTVLNPGSCSSAMNLLNIRSLSSNVTLGGSSIDDTKSSSSTVYYHNVHKKKRSTNKTNLNPGSCASALNLFDMVFDESQQQRGGSMSDITFRFGGGGGNNHALSSSLPRRSSSLTTTTSGGLPHRRRSRSSINTSSTRFNDNGKRNAEWGEFK